MDQQGVNLGGMLSGGSPTYPLQPPWYMYQQAMQYNIWFRNGFREARPAIFSQGQIDAGTPIELCYTIINSDVSDQLEVVDENRVPLQELQEGLSTIPDEEGRKPPLNELPKGDATDEPTDVTHEHLDTLSKPNTGEQNVPSEEEELPGKLQHRNELHTANCSSALQKQCFSLSCSCTEKNSSSEVTGSNMQQDQVHQIDVIQEPHHILSDTVDSLGKHLNALVTHVHHMPSNRVKFHIETEVWQGEDHHRRLSLTREEPVTDPSDFDRYPEAFDCRRILKHMRKHDNVRKYAGILDYSRSKDLKREIDGILGRIPGKRTSRSPRPTWDSLIDTLHKMKSFIEQAAAGLRRNNEEDLAAELDKGYDNLEASIAKAAKAQEMSHR